MAYSYFEVIASGGNTFNIPFDYIEQTEVSVYVDGVETPFTFTSSNVIDITPAPANGALVRIDRATNLSERAVDFASGAVLTEEDLDKSNIQVYHAAQEALDKVEQTMQVDVDGKWDGQDRVIKNVADPVADTDAVNRQFITTNLPAINRVHQSISAVDTVAADLLEPVSEIETVSNSITNVNIVGNAITNVNTTASHIANVDRVALSANNVDVVKASIANVDTTAGSIGNVNNVGNNITAVVNVSTNMADVNTVATQMDKVITTANDLNEAVSEINTVAGHITNVDTVGLNIANVNTVAGISTDVTKLVDRYFVQSTQPTSGMVQGDLWYSTTQNQLYTYTGTKWELTSAYSEAMVRENNYVAVANQTAFVGTDKNGYLMTLVDGATEFVYQNGILIEPTIDYTLDYATATVNLVVAASLDDEIRVVQINPFDSLEYNQLVDFRDQADAAQAASELARDLAQNYRDTALGARDAAQVSQAAALASQNSAASSANASANSAVAAATSEANAATSEANAYASANVAANPWEVIGGTQDIKYVTGDTYASNLIPSAMKFPVGTVLTGGDNEAVKVSFTTRGMYVQANTDSVAVTDVAPDATEGQIALRRESATGAGDPYISYHDDDGSRIGYLQITDTGSAILNVESRDAYGGGLVALGSDTSLTRWQGGMDATTTRINIHTGSNPISCTVSDDDFLVYDHIIAGYCRTADDTSWYYNTGENGVYAYSGSSGNVATTTASDCYTYLYSRTVADGSDAFNCTVDGNVKIELDSSGNCYNDGVWSTTAADYAEMFEWADGNPNAEDRVGYPVILEGNKIRIATDADDPALIMGIVSAAPGVLGDNDLKKWNGWAARDDWGRPVMRDVEMVKWIEDDAGRETTQTYRVSHVPEDMVIPDNAVYYTTQETDYNPDWDRTVEYTPRSERPEWDAIGLMGKLRKHKNTPAGDRWIKMRDINDNIEEWLVR